MHTDGNGLFTGSIARSAKPRYFSYSEAEFFAPQGRHVAPMGVTFGMEGGGDRSCQISPHRCNDIGSQN